MDATTPHPDPAPVPIVARWLSGEGRRRAVSIALTVAIHLLLFLLLLNLAPEPFQRLTSDALSTFDVAPDRGVQTQPAPTRRPEQRREQRRAQAARAAPQRPTVPPRPPVVDTPVPEFMRMSRDQFAATDVSRLPKSAAPGDGDRNETASAGDSSAAYGPGAGPGGARLFNAEWVREPTSAELRTYMPPAPDGSWAMIACRTIPDNRVENCQPLGESPLGSKLATGLRRAAWQFKIRPPRVGGKPMIGEWVRIRIDFTERGIEARR